MIDQCPACGSHVLYDVELLYEGTLGFRPDVYGYTPELGDTIASCGDCHAFVVLDEHGNPAHAPSSDQPAEQAPAEEPSGDQPPAQEPPAPLMGMPAGPTTQGG